MASLFFLILFLIAIAGIYYHTRHMSSVKKRMTLVIGIPLLLFYILFFKPLTATIFTPLYCLAYSNTKIKEYISPEQWKEEGFGVMNVSLQNMGDFDFLVSNFDKSKYIEDINVDGIDYNLVYLNQGIPNLAIYISDNSKLFGRYIYLYYDIGIHKPIISLEEYVSEYRWFSGGNNVSSCNDNALSDLRNYFMKKYLNKQ